MRIGYLTSRLPYPPIDGGRIRTYYFLRHLLRNHQVTLYSIESRVSKDATTYQRPLSGLNQAVFRISKFGYVRNAINGLFSEQPLQVRLYRSGGLAGTLARDVEQGALDVIIVHLVRMAEYARPFKTIPRILDMTDSIHLNYARMPRVSLSPHGIVALIERERLFHYESDVASWFDNILLASPLDIAWLQRRNSESKMTLIPTGIEMSAYPFHEGSYDPNRIIFVGKLDYLPNTDAVLYFAREILPLIRRAVPSVKFVVAGWNPPVSVQKLAEAPYVKVLANVPDVRPEIAKSALSVAPMRFGAGIQVKILESLALGTPAVATESVLGAFGKGGKEAILVGRDAHEFAEKVIGILEDKACREQLRRAGRKLIESQFQWDQVLAPLDRILDSIAGKQLQARPEWSLRGKPF